MGVVHILIDLLWLHTVRSNYVPKQVVLIVKCIIMRSQAMYANMSCVTLHVTQSWVDTPHSAYKLIFCSFTDT